MVRACCWSLLRWPFFGSASRICTARSRRVTWYLPACWVLDRRRLLHTHFMFRARKRLSERHQRCSSQLRWACWVRCSTGLQPHPLRGVAWPRTRPQSSLFRLHCSFLFIHVVFCLGVSKLLGGNNNAVASIRGITPALHLHALAFEIFVDGKKECDLFQHVGINIGVIPDIGEARVVLSDCEHLLVENALVQHLEQPDGAHFLHTTGETRAGHQHEHIEWIA